MEWFMSLSKFELAGLCLLAWLIVVIQIVKMVRVTEDERKLEQELIEHENKTSKKKEV